MSSPEILTPESLLARIRREGVRRTAQALRKPPLASALLQAMADLPAAEAPEARAFVAAYPLAPSHLLESLAAQAPDLEVLGLLATNPRTPPHLLIEFSAHPAASVRAQTALHPQLPPRELLTLADDPEPAVRRALAQNSALRLPQQALLAADANSTVRAALADQPGLATPAALVLAIDESAPVRLHTVATAPADDDTLLGWAASDEEDIQLALLRRRTLPEAAERLLVQSTHASVRRAVRAQVELDTADLLFLATNGEAEERQWLAARPAMPRPLQRVLAQDTDPAVRAALAANPAIEPTIAAYFVNLADEPACVALATNPAAGEELIQGVAATRRPAVLAALAYRENLDPALASLLVARSPVFRRHWAVQDRPLSGLDADTARTLAADPMPGIRALAVRGHHWRRADLYDFARDPVARVRLAAVQHPNAPDELLTDALADPAPEVAAAARVAQTGRTAALAQKTHRDISLMPPVKAPPAPAAGTHERDTGLLTKLTRLFR